MLNDTIKGRLYDEEAEKLGITLGPRYAIDRPSIQSDVSEATARSIISTWLSQQSRPSLVENLVADDRRRRDVDDSSASPEEKKESLRKNLEGKMDSLRRR